MLLPLGVGRPGPYENWRRCARAAVECRSGTGPTVKEDLKEIPIMGSPSADIVAGVMRAPALHALNMNLYVAILHSLEGGRRETSLGRAHEQDALWDGSWPCVPGQRVLALVGEPAKGV